MTKDFKRKWSEADEIALDDLMKQIVAVSLVLICSLTLAMVLTGQFAQAESITTATRDNLISEDMASYTEIYGHNQTFTEQDMQ